MTFEQLGLNADILRVLEAEGTTEPTPAQEQVIPHILGGKDVLVATQVDPGKTGSFTLPIMHRLMADKEDDKPNLRALILTPTRELAAQITEEIKEQCRELSLRWAVVFGGVRIGPQIGRLKRGVDLVVATPGRLLDHADKQTIDLSKVDMLVLDEADRMLDMGFMEDVDKVLALLPEQRQNMIFAGTMNDAVKSLSEKLLKSPEVVEIAGPEINIDEISQHVYRVDKRRKTELLAHLVEQNEWTRILVFIRTKHAANRLAYYLGKSGVPSVAMHGNKNPAARAKAIEGFATGELKVLVATDIAARGMDMDDLQAVVNYDLPQIPDDYIQRIGHASASWSLVCIDEAELLDNLQKHLGKEIDSSEVEGFEVDPTIEPEPLRKERPPRKPRHAKADAEQGDDADSSDENFDEKPRQQRAKSKKKRQNKPQQRRNDNQGNQGNHAPRAQTDEYGDVNGNTMQTDNSNRDAVYLAGGNEIARRGRGRGGNGNGNGNRAQQANGNRNGNQRRRRRKGNDANDDAPSLLGG
jgi:ATP-dependent RNA helicase RhlE